MRVVDCRPTFGHNYVSLTAERLEHHKQVRRPVAFVFVISSGRAAWGRGDRHTGFLHKLLAGFVEADHGAFWVVRPMVNLQHVLHRADEIGVLLGGDHPLLTQPGLQLVFLSVCRTVSLPIESTTSNSTNLSASSLKVHRALPSGAGPQAMAMSRASCAPSSL
jgi:hypothetical protein